MQDLAEITDDAVAKTMVSSLFSAFFPVVYNDAPEQPEEKTEEPQAADDHLSEEPDSDEKQDAVATEEDGAEEEEEPEDVCIIQNLNLSS